MSKNIEAKLDDLVQSVATKDELADAVKTITDNLLALSLMVSKLDVGTKRSPSGGKSTDVVIKGSEPDPAAAKRASVPMLPTKPIWLLESCKFSADESAGNTKSRDKRLTSFGLDKAAIAEATEKVNGLTKNASHTGTRWQELFYKQCVTMIEARKGTAEASKFRQGFETHVASVTAQAKESNFTPVDSTSNKTKKPAAKADDSDDDAPAKPVKGGKKPAAKADDSDDDAPAMPVKGGKKPADDSDDDTPPAKPAKGAAKPVKGGKPAAKSDSEDSDDEQQPPAKPKKGKK